MPTLLESLPPVQSVVPTSVMEPAEPLPAPAPAIDEFAAFEDAAPADEFAAFEDAPDEFSAFTDADDLDIKSVEELAASRDTFNPKEYYASHPELFSDPIKAAKFLDVYRIRDEEGLDAGQVAKAAVKEALPTVGKVAGGVWDVFKGATTVGVQPVVNVFGGLLTGDIFDKQRREELLAETKKQQKRGVAQFGAGSEASATGIADLGRQAIRKMASSPNQSPFAVGLAGSGVSEEQITGKPRVRKSDQELLQQIAADVEFGKQLGEIVQGRGESAKAVGLDADTLAKEGITLDPEVIERLSLVDPLTIIAGGGIFKGVTAAGKIAFTASTRAAAEATLQKITQVATRAATAPIRGIGKGIELAGTLSKKVAPLAPPVGMVSGGVAGGLSGAGAGYLAGVGAQRTLRIGGKLLESGGRGVAAAGEALGNSRILQQTLRGAVEGVVATAPLAAATDDDLAAGTLLGAGIGLGGGIRGAIATAEAPALAISRSRLAPKNIVYPETKSPGYRRDKTLDAAHEEAIQSVPQAEKNEINSFRETARKLDSELYFLDDANFAVATQENAARVLGRELTGQEKVDLGRTAEAEGFFDFTVPGPEGKPRRVIFLRQSADAATHEVGHLFFKTLAPERQAELVQSVRDSYTPEQIEQVRIDQSQRLGEDKSTDYAINEIAADNFSQVFRNTPVSELTAPPGLLQEIRRNVTDFAENLGLDLTAGERTASVGVASSLRFNDVVRDAARELLSPKPRQPVVTPKAAPITLEQAARDLGPLVEPRVVRQTPARPTPEARATPETAPVDETRKIADEAPDTALPGAAMSQKEILGTVADIIAGKEGARYNYRNAPDVPGAAEEASRAPRRAEIEQARNLPEDLRRMTETTGIPYRIVKSSGGVVQVLDWAPDMLASNALRVAKALSDLAVKDPNNPVLQKIQYGLDVQKGEWTEQGWRDIFADAETFSANQGKGFAGSGIALDFPPEVVAAGRTAPAIAGTPVLLEQGIADFQNMLYNLRVPKTPRQGTKLPGNLVAQKISEATLPGRLRQPALVEPRKAGETGVRKPFKGGEEILDPNPLRAEFETALQGASIPLPDGIEVVRRLNLEHIADVVAEPNLPKTVGGVAPVLEAGFAAPKPKEISAMGAEDFDAATKAFKGKYGGGLTGMAAELGAGVKDAAGLAELQAGLVDSQTKIAAARVSRDIDTMFAETGKAQFFREAVETATGIGPSESFIQKTFDPDFKSPLKEPAAQFAAPKKKAEDKYALKTGTSGGFSKAWILPGGEPVQLGGTWHHQWLSENPDVAAKYKLDVPPFEGGDAEGVRESALKAGFGRVNYSKSNGTLTVEARAKDWRRIKSSIERIVESNLDNIDNMTVHLLDESAVRTVDSQTTRLFDFDDAEKLQHLPFISEGEVRGQYAAPKSEREILPRRVTEEAVKHIRAGGYDVAMIHEGFKEAGEAQGFTPEEISSKWAKVMSRAWRPTRGQFAAPKAEGELGIVLPKDEARLKRKFNAMVAASKEKYPEAIPLELKKDESGNYQLDKDGKPVPVVTEYGLFETPLAKAAAKGKRGDDVRENAIADAYAAKIKAAHAEAIKNPEIAAGADWYSLARTKLRKLFGDDTKFFAELLAATSAQTDVPTNFRYSIDAYNRFKQGEYDTQIVKYKEGKVAWETRNEGLLAGMNLPVDVTRARFMETWIETHQLKPTQSNGKLFGANSDAVMRVLDGSWREEVKGPKTPNFAGNLTGDTFEATIDVWAARALHRLGNEGSTKRWRILPKNESGVSDADFFMAQKAFRKAADNLEISPDSLQAILWFAEKDVWGKKGWTKTTGAAKTDFNVLLEVTARSKPDSGKLVIDQASLAKKAALKEKYQLDFDLEME